MKFPKYTLKKLKRQAGFTLIDLMLGLVISGILGGGIATLVYQIGSVNNTSNARLSSVSQVENAIHYINRDMQMAQKVEADGIGYWLRLTWNTWEDNKTVQVVYSLSASELSRQYSLTGGTTQNACIANHITGISAAAPDLNTSPPEKAWTIVLTAITSSGSKQATETRQMQIIPRPGS